MRNKTSAVLLFLSLLAALCIGTAFAEEAAPTSDSLIRDGVPQTPTVYKINGSNYFKIRDLAAILNGTAKQFSVGYDGEKQSVTADTGAGYVKQPTDLTGAPAGGNKTAAPSSDAIYINGVLCQAEVYKIDGMNYFKLRDLGQALDFAVGWDDATKTVALDTSKGYETQSPVTPSISDQELLELAQTALEDMNNKLIRLLVLSDIERAPYDSDDYITTSEGVQAFRAYHYKSSAEAETDLRTKWYSRFSRKYPTFEDHFTKDQLLDYNGALYVLDLGIGDRPGYEVVKQIVSRTDNEVVFRGNWIYDENDPDSFELFEFSLVFEDGTWKYGYYKDLY